MRVSVIGLGKVGLAYSSFISSKGHDVIGIDTIPDYVNDLQNGKYECLEPNVQENLKNIKFDTVDCGGSDICVILVATPTCHAGYDHSQLESVLKNIDEKKHKRVLVSCTTQPGFCDRWKDKVDNMYYNPLFIQLGNIVNHERNNKHILIGGEKDELLDNYFKSLHGDDVNIHYMSHMSAEIAKLSLNCIITTKISFANMVGEAMWKCDKKDEIKNVLDFIGSDKRIGKECFNFGWGYGGPCFPRDNRALCTFLRQYGAADYIPIATHETNERHAVTMAMMKQPDSEFDDLNYKPDIPFKFTEESHKIKTLEIMKSIGIDRDVQM